jgi:hypothetical protein
MVEGISLSVLFLTAVANQLLGRSFAPTPVNSVDLIQLKAQTLPDNRLAPDFGRQLTALFEELEISCDFFVKFCLECWQEDFAAIEPEDIDPETHLCLLIAD